MGLLFSLTSGHTVAHEPQTWIVEQSQWHGFNFISIKKDGLQTLPLRGNPAKQILLILKHRLSG